MRLSTGTNLVLHADDTKIWRSLKSCNDYCSLQNDINHLNSWSIENKMRFHPSKCKVHSISGKKYCNRIFTIPFIRFQYLLGNTPLDYTIPKADLWVAINESFGSIICKQSFVANSCEFTQICTKSACVSQQLANFFSHELWPTLGKPLANTGKRRRNSPEFARIRAEIAIKSF